jgi:peptidoglycan/xylan/chitin deacetylase (PgdA/CDA1 family)
MIARKLLKGPGLLMDLLSDRSPGVVVLMYHRVTGDLPLELDIPTQIFARQMKYLASHASVISLNTARSFLREQTTLDRDHFVLTFDDAFRDFYTTAFPILQRYDLPATLYVPTLFVEEGRPSPLTASTFADDVAPCSWPMLRDMCSSSLLTVGSHTHTHPELTELNDEAIRSEITKSHELFGRRLERTPKHFAYPRGEWNRHIDSIVDDYYETRVLTGEGWRIRPTSAESLRFPRVPVLRSDGFEFFRLKASGYAGLGDRHLINYAKSMMAEGPYQ